MNARYLIRPKAEHDVDEQAYYLAKNASPGIGHKFLVAAHETFALLATQPEMGWRAPIPNPRLRSLRVFRISGFQKMLVLYVPVESGVEIVRVIHGSRNLLSLLRG